MATESDRVRAMLQAQKLERTQFRPTIDGRPMDEALDDPDLDLSPVDNQRQDLRDKVAREQYLAAVKARKMQQQEQEGPTTAQQYMAERRKQLTQSLVATDPIPTGDPRIDKAGELRARAAGPMSVIDRYKPLEEYPSDSDVAIKADLASQGYDFTTGLGAKARARLAAAPLTRQRQAEAMKVSLKPILDEVPAGMEALKYVPAIDEWFVPIRQGDGKFRYTAFDESGLSLGDFADMLDPSEIGSIVGATIGNIAGKNPSKALSFIKSAGGRAAAKSGTFGLVGRELGLGLEFIADIAAGGKQPTKQELLDAGIREAKIEAFDFLAGEILGGLGVAFNRVSQDIAANLTNKELSELSVSDIERANVSILQTKEDMATIQSNVTGNVYSTTLGRASNNASMISQEAAAVKNKSAVAKQEFNAAVSERQRAARDYIDTQLGEDVSDIAGPDEIIEAANDVAGSRRLYMVQKRQNVMGVNGRPDPFAERTIQIRPKDASEGNQTYLDMVARDEDTWQVQWVGVEKELQDQGIAKEMYLAALQVAEENGVRIVSDRKMSPGSTGVWESLIESGYITGVKRNKAVKDPKTGWFNSADGKPIFEMPERVSVVDSLAAKTSKPKVKVNADGELEQVARAKTRFDNVIEGKLLKAEKKQLIREINTNVFSKAKFNNMVLEDYTRKVYANGKFSTEAFGKWVDKDLPKLQDYYSLEELSQMRDVRGLQNLVRRDTIELDDVVANINRVVGPKITKDVLQKPQSVWKSINNASPAKLDRVMRIIRSKDPALADNLLKHAKDDISRQWATAAESANYPKMRTFIKEKGAVIAALMGDRTAAKQYTADLQLIEREMFRNYTSSKAASIQAETNPTLLSLTRVAFGPLSRIQRGFTATRKAQIRAAALDTAAIITDPEDLRMLAKYKNLTIESKAGARIATQLGLIDAPIIGDFDPDDENDRARLAEYVIRSQQVLVDENVE